MAGELRPTRHLRMTWGSLESALSMPITLGCRPLESGILLFSCLVPKRHFVVKFQLFFVLEGTLAPFFGPHWKRSAVLQLEAISASYPMSS